MGSQESRSQTKSLLVGRERQARTPELRDPGDQGGERGMREPCGGTGVGASCEQGPARVWQRGRQRGMDPQPRSLQT